MSISRLCNTQNCYKKKEKHSTSAKSVSSLEKKIANSSRILCLLNPKRLEHEENQPESRPIARGEVHGTECVRTPLPPSQAPKVRILVPARSKFSVQSVLSLISIKQ